jgi:tellurite resistance protein
MSAVRRMPLTFFSFVMGTSGVSIMLFQASEYWGLPQAPAVAAWLVAVGLWLWLALTHVIHVRASIRALSRELHDENTGVFAALSLMSLILITITLERIAPTTAHVIWAFAAVGQFLLGAWIYSRWITKEIDVSNISGAWLLPPTSGNLVAAVGAATFGYDTMAIVLIGAGFLSWIFVNATITNRQITHRTLLNPDQRPASFIQLNPPVLTVNAILPALSATPNVVEYGLWGYAIFLFTILLFTLPDLARIPFGAYWWSATFPVAAFALATIRLAQYGSDPVSPVLAPLLALLAIGLLLWVGVMTVISARRHTLVPSIPSRGTPR